MNLNKDFHFRLWNYLRLNASVDFVYYPQKPMHCNLQRHDDWDMSLSLWEGQELKLLENTMQRRIFVYKRKEIVTGGWKENCIMKSFRIVTIPPNRPIIKIKLKSTKWMSK